MQSNFSSKDRISSAGIAAPPDMQSRRVDASAPSAESQCSIALYIVGTPWKTVTRSRSRISSALSGRKRGSIVTVEPVAIALFIVQVCPNEWKSGSAPSSTSSSVKPASLPPVALQLRYRFAWVSSAPFGVPVVPDVYRITAVSSASRTTAS